MLGLQNAKKAAEVSLGGLAFEPMISSLLGTPPGHQIDALGQMPSRLLSATVVVAARPAIAGGQRGFCYLAEERHDFAKVTANLRVVKNKFIEFEMD